MSSLVELRTGTKNFGKILSMSTIKDVLVALRELPDNTSRGFKFEDLMVRYFKLHPVLSNEYDRVCRWRDWEYNSGRSDAGIDLVARNRESGEWTAIQCKFYDEHRRLYKKDVDSFFTESGRTFTTDRGKESFTNRIIISTAEWSETAEESLGDQSVPVQRIGMADIADAPVDWDIVYPSSDISFEVNLKLHKQYDPKPHQSTAIKKVLAGFETHDRGKLVMACGTGKTFTALRLAEEVAEKNGGRARVLFAVPSIALLGQTLREWAQQAKVPLRSFAVCSDKKVARDVEDIKAYDIEIPVTTDGKKLAAEINSGGKRAKGLQVVFTTYQSMEVINAAQQAGAPKFDLVICDEAHRTTGITLFGEDPSAFTRVHDGEFIKASKRLYMTATPRLYDENLKDKAEEHSAEISSMDDEFRYGPEFHRIGFGEAVDKGLLTDYKVLVLAVDEGMAARTLQHSVTNSNGELTLDTATKIIGCWNGLAKRSGSFQGTKEGFAEDAKPMQRAVAFARDIKTSKEIANSFPLIASLYADTMREKAALDDTVSSLNLGLEIESDHVDGTMNAPTRTEKLRWLKDPTIDTETTRILTNARCLSEGVDVPALDAVLFMNPRNSVVDVVQSVGRVMRLAEGKKYGYIILPVGVPAGVAPEKALADNKRFKVVWQVLNALRAHDDRFNAVVNSMALNKSEKEPSDPNDPNKKIDFDFLSDDPEKLTDDDHDEKGRQLALFSLEEWQEALYTRIVNKVGNRTYWEDWADDVAEITQTQITRIKAILETASPELLREFDVFVEGLKGNLNDSITENDAISMLSQHMITAPVFNALFNEYDFARHNAVSQVMQRMVDALHDQNLEKELEQLEDFYRSVEVRASEVSSATGKQQVVKDLYERFFRKAFPKQAEALGIVYTPVEIVDFVLHAANDASRKHLKRGLTDQGVNILDPFTGTGTFIVRLLQSDLIKAEDLERKYKHELYASEIMLLAYYTAAVNIESTFNSLQKMDQRDSLRSEEINFTFPGIALADTFQVNEADDALDLEVFKENNDSIERQLETPIHVVVGNPPWSAKQQNANDNNANQKYPTLDSRIEKTYAAKSGAKLKSKLYDSYIRALRLCSDRIEDQGVLAFVTNNGWIDANGADGIRKCLQEEFSSIYIYNLRGDSNVGGETAKREGGNVFDIRVGVSILIAVKSNSLNGCDIRYFETPDFMTKAEKLSSLATSRIENVNWRLVEPNEYGDWVAQRSSDFLSWIPLVSDSAKTEECSFFTTSGLGVSTNRDNWVYNFSEHELVKNVEKTYSFINSIMDDLPPGSSAKEFVNSNPELLDQKKTKWSDSLFSKVQRREQFELDKNSIRTGLYRPFQKQKLYFHRLLNDRIGIGKKFSPTPFHKNVGFYQVGKGSAVPFSVIATDSIPNLHVTGAGSGGHFFARFTWELCSDQEALAPELINIASFKNHEESGYGEIGEVIDGYKRVDNITEEIKELFSARLGERISGDRIFHFVYGKLHEPNYRSTFSGDLRKMHPRLPLPDSLQEFKKFETAGEKLMQLHINFDSVPPFTLTNEIRSTADVSDPDTWKVSKLNWGTRKDPTTGKKVKDFCKIVVNKNVTLSGIPEEVHEFVIGSKSALAWVLDRFVLKRDTKSGLLNDPNDWASEVGNPRYIVDLICKVTTVAVETMKIIKSL